MGTYWRSWHLSAGRWRSLNSGRRRQVRLLRQLGESWQNKKNAKRRRWRPQGKHSTMQGTRDETANELVLAERRSLQQSGRHSDGVEAWGAAGPKAPDND